MHHSKARPIYNVIVGPSVDYCNYNFFVKSYQTKIAHL